MIELMKNIQLDFMIKKKAGKKNTVMNLKSESGCGNRSDKCIPGAIVRTNHVQNK